jgi:hypothetical protein
MAMEPSYTSDESSVLNPQQPTKPEMRPAAEVFGFLLEKRRPSNSMPINVDPTSVVLPATRNVGLPVKLAEVSASTDNPSSIGSILVDPPHTTTILNRTRIPLAHGSLPDGSSVGQLTVTATATRASRIPRGRRSLQLLSDPPTLNSETQLLTTPSTEPAKTTLIPAYNYDILRSTTNTTERAHLAASHLTSERDDTSALAPKRSAHRRSASCGPSRLLPNSWTALSDTTGATELRSDDGKENTSSSVSTVKNVGLCTFSPSSFGVVVGSHAST